MLLTLFTISNFCLISWIASHYSVVVLISTFLIFRLELIFSQYSSFFFFFLFSDWFAFSHVLFLGLSTFTFLITHAAGDKAKRRNKWMASLAPCFSSQKAWLHYKTITSANSSTVETYACTNGKWWQCRLIICFRSWCEADCDHG